MLSSLPHSITFMWWMEVPEVFIFDHTEAPDFDMDIMQPIHGPEAENQIDRSDE